MKKYIYLTGLCLLLAGCTTKQETPVTQEESAKAETPVPNPEVERWMKSAKFITACYNVEDMLLIPGTNWIVGSGVVTQGPGMEDKVITKGYLHLFDAKAETGGRLESKDIAIKPDVKSFPQTTTPPNWEVFSPHGIALGAQKGKVITFYAVNHGGREAVEVFTIDISGSLPKFTWIGSVPAPEDGFIDALAWIPGTDGFVITSLLDPRDPHGAMEKQMKGLPNGWVKEWHPDSGWKILPGTEKFSTPNGIIISEDGKQVYVAASTGFCIYKVTRGETKPHVDSVKVAGVPDNVRWSADGKSILTAVHTEEIEKFVAAQIESVKIGGSMMTKFNITRIDPVAMKAEVVMPSGLYGAFGACTNAIEVGNRLWLGSTKSDRVAIFNLNP